MTIVRDIKPAIEELYALAVEASNKYAEAHGYDPLDEQLVVADVLRVLALAGDATALDLLVAEVNLAGLVEGLNK